MDGPTRPPEARGTEATYDAIGVGYDGSRRADRRIATRLIEFLRAGGGRHLDVACGTANYTLALRAAGLAMIGIDRSATMLAAARIKAPTLPLFQADVHRLPFPAGAFEGAVCTNSIHHFDDLPGAFTEIGRVLTAGARLVVLTARREQMRAYWLNAYFPVALERSISEMPSDETVRDVLAAGSLRLVTTQPYEIPPDPVDLFLYAGKHRPQLYLDPVVRAGISTFARLADAAEVDVGLERLRRDIASGEIRNVMERYRAAALGDYVFVVAERVRRPPAGGGRRGRA